MRHERKNEIKKNKQKKKLDSLQLHQIVAGGGASSSASFEDEENGNGKKSTTVSSLSSTSASCTSSSYLFSLLSDCEKNEIEEESCCSHSSVTEEKEALISSSSYGREELPSNIASRYSSVSSSSSLSQGSRISSMKSRIIICDDDPHRLLLLAKELTRLQIEICIETTSPRKSFPEAVCSLPFDNQRPRFPVMVFFINVNNGNVEPRSRFGKFDNCKMHPNPDMFQLFQVCHISDDFLANDDDVNLMRYVFTMTSTVLEIALCVHDTAAKFAKQLDQRHSLIPPSISVSSDPTDYSGAVAFRAFMQSKQRSSSHHLHKQPKDHSNTLYSPKVCVSRSEISTLPRIRYVNDDFEKCFGHPSSWIRGRSITVLAGLLTSTHHMLDLCSSIDSSSVARERELLVDNHDFKRQKDIHVLTLYTSDGEPIDTIIRVSIVPNMGEYNSVDSVAMLSFVV